MGTCWRNPILLPPWKRAIIHGITVLAPVPLAVIPFWSVRPEWERIVHSVVVAAAGLLIWAAIVEIRISYFNHPEKKYVDCVLRTIGATLWAKPPENFQALRYRFRITLFEAKKLHWFQRLFLSKNWTKKLVPRTRHPSTEADNEPYSIWYVNEIDGEICEGVAGKIFFRDIPVVTETLPDLYAKMDRFQYSMAVQEYARLAWSTPERVRKAKYSSRVIGGIPIHRKDGALWGVLVYDCPEPTAITADWFNETSAAITAALTEMLESEK